MLKINKSLKKFQALSREIKECKKCKLSETRSHALVGEGDLPAKLIMVAQAPGYNEDSAGRMFVGPSGKKLDELLNHADISREEIFMTNILRCMLPKYRKPKMDEIETCTPYLDEEIELIDPEVISTLGFFAANYIFKKYGIENQLDFPNTCGRIFSVNDKKIISLRHPTALIHDDSSWEIMSNNFRKLKKY